jgi:hypothetical protein
MQLCSQSERSLARLDKNCESRQFTVDLRVQLGFPIAINGEVFQVGAEPARYQDSERH